MTNCSRRMRFSLSISFTTCNGHAPHPQARSLCNPGVGQREPQKGPQEMSLIPMNISGAQLGFLSLRGGNLLEGVR